MIPNCQRAMSRTSMGTLSAQYYYGL
jgi:hypothetical protein